jgi:uncharacterized protein YyaL (SSP411 family)
VLATHATARGGIAHDARPAAASAGHVAAADVDTPVLYLADNAAFGFALARLHEATKKPEYLDAAKRIAQFLLEALYDTQASGFFASTPDPNAVGVFAARRKPFEDNVMAVRFLARLSRLSTTVSKLTISPASPEPYRAAIARTLAVVTTRAAVADRGRMIGDLLLALDEARALQGAPEPPRAALPSRLFPLKAERAAVVRRLVVRAEGEERTACAVVQHLHGGARSPR